MEGAAKGTPHEARPAMRELYTVNQLAEELGITGRAIRFYEAKGLIAPRRAGITRVFDRRDRARLILVLRGKRLGFSLAEIRDFLDLYDADRTQVAQVCLLLEKTRRRIKELERQRRDLEQTLDELHEVERQALELLQDRGIPVPAGTEDQPATGG